MFIWKIYLDNNFHSYYKVCIFFELKLLKTSQFLFEKNNYLKVIEDKLFFFELKLLKTSQFLFEKNNYLKVIEDKLFFFELKLLKASQFLFEKNNNYLKVIEDKLYGLGIHPSGVYYTAPST